jgi:hypothetical protein
MAMSKDQEKHLQHIKDTVCERIDKKYRAGVVEHGGNIWENSAGWFKQEKENEISDFLVYAVSEDDVRGGNEWLNK